MPTEEGQGRRRGTVWVEVGKEREGERADGRKKRKHERITSKGGPRGEEKPLKPRRRVDPGEWDKPPQERWSGVVDKALQGRSHGMVLLLEPQHRSSGLQWYQQQETFVRWRGASSSEETVRRDMFAAGCYVCTHLFHLNTP